MIVKRYLVSAQTSAELRGKREERGEERGEMQATWTQTVSSRTSEQVTWRLPMDCCDWCGAYLVTIGRMGQLQGNALAR
jgi:hypothetical protein